MKLVFRGEGAGPKNALAVTATLLVLYLIVVYVVVPWIAPRMMVDSIEEQARVHASVDEIRLDPFALRVHVRAFALDGLDGEPLIRIERFEADLELLDNLILGALTAGVRLVLDAR